MRYVAFLRAINVGGHIVKMDHLRRLFESIGFADVETFIASGNVIFESRSRKPANLELTIQTQLRTALGYSVDTFLRSTSEVARIAAHRPFRKPATDAGGNLYIAFLRDELSLASQRKVLSFKSETDDFHVHRREVYWLCRTLMSESAFSGAAMEKALGTPATWRNATTVQRLATKYPCD